MSTVYGSDGDNLTSTPYRLWETMAYTEGDLYLSLPRLRPFLPSCETPHARERQRYRHRLLTIMLSQSYVTLQRGLIRWTYWR